MPVRSASSPPRPRSPAGTACSCGNRSGASTRGSRSRWPPRARRRIRLGTMLTPPSRRRPWELASQVATVDRLSGGRVILSVGLGARRLGVRGVRRGVRPAHACGADGRVPRDRHRPLGRPAVRVRRHPLPRQADRLPDDRRAPCNSRGCRSGVWVRSDAGRRWSAHCAGTASSRRSSTNGDVRQATLDEVAGVRALVGDRPYDIVIEGVGSEHSPAAWHDAGASWWIESMWDAMREDSAATAALDRLREGPPTT